MQLYIYITIHRQSWASLKISITQLNTWEVSKHQIEVDNRPSSFSLATSAMTAAAEVQTVTAVCPLIMTMAWRSLAGVEISPTGALHLWNGIEMWRGVGSWAQASCLLLLLREEKKKTLNGCTSKKLFIFSFHSIWIYPYINPSQLANDTVSDHSINFKLFSSKLTKQLSFIW